MNIQNKTLFAKGKRGFIYKAKLNGKDVAVKIKNPESKAMSRIANEGYYLEQLNEHGIGPRLYYFNDEMVVMELIEGKPIIEFIAATSRFFVRKILKDILTQCYKLDSLNINKYEMHHPVKHILIRNNKPILIDFERCRKTLKPKNVTQFCQFIARLIPDLSKKGIEIDREKILKEGERYKREGKISRILRLI